MSDGRADADLMGEQSPWLAYAVVRAQYDANGLPQLRVSREIYARTGRDSTFELSNFYRRWEVESRAD